MIPSKIRINQVPDYYTKTIGKYANGQFIATIAATLPMPHPEDWEKHKRWYSILHTFTKEGVHQKTEVWFAGTTFDGEDEVLNHARNKRDDMVASLVEHVFCDVAIELFSVEVDGFVFGLVDASVKEEGYEAVHLLPNDLAFFAPWDGEFDT